jgi:hypothetical protein
MRQLRVEDLFTSFKHWAEKIFLLELRKEELRKAYKATSKDQGQNEAKEWDTTVRDRSEGW